jgi:hypothetical protein
MSSIRSRNGRSLMIVLIVMRFDIVLERRRAAGAASSGRSSEGALGQ